MHTEFVIRIARPFAIPHTKIQGELVDSVEHHVESSTNYIQQGHLELKQAEIYQSKARKVQLKLKLAIYEI